MGTSVLLPQDCLSSSSSSSRSRHKHQFAEMIYRVESSPRVRRDGLQSPPLKNMAYSFYQEHPKQNIISARFLKERDSGILPLPSPSGSLPINIPYNETEVRSGKILKKLEKRDARSNAKIVYDESVVTVLQRPRSNNLVMDSAVTMSQKPKYRSDVQAIKLLSKNGSDMSLSEMLQNSSLVSKDNNMKPKQGEKHLNLTGFQKHSKPLLTKKNMQQQPEVNNFLNSEPKKVNKHVAPQISVRSDNINKQIVKFKANNAISTNWIPLRRTATDPEVMNSVFDKNQSNPEVCNRESKVGGNHGFIKNITVASQERWAGPAYSSSPSPSALPLPKFSRPLSQMSSPDFLPKVANEEKSIDMVVSVPLSVSLPSMSSVSLVETWDTALATKSLRKMLNLDPI